MAEADMDTTGVVAEEEATEQVEGSPAAEEAQPKEPEKPKENEEDAPADGRPKVAASSVSLNATDASLNAIVSPNGVCQTWTDGGIQNLFAGARATVGILAGRYSFEVKILEMISRGGERPGSSGGWQAQSRCGVRIGLSLAGSSLTLADGSADNVAFDTEGFFVAGKNRKKVCRNGLGKFNVYTCVVNLEKESANANTVSLFRDGVRVCEPQAIPENLVGKALFPTVTYRNASIHVNFGANGQADLPFKCRQVADAAKADVKEAVTTSLPKVPEVVFPIGLPEQGYFDWVDQFGEANPDFVELSERKIVDHATRSGQAHRQGTSNDRPDQTEDVSMRRLLKESAPLSRRNIVVPELKANLVPAERAVALRRFKQAGYKTRAVVVVGTPTDAYKAKVHEKLLADKRQKAEVEKARKLAEEARKKMIEDRKRKLAGKEIEEPVKEDEAMEAEVEVTLTDEEKQTVFRKLTKPDISEVVLSKAYTNFALPTTEEGFDEVSFEWSQEADAVKVVKDWVFNQKLSQRVQDIKIGEDFKNSRNQWSEAVRQWRALQNEWKDPKKRKVLEAKALEAKKAGAEETGEEFPTSMTEAEWEDLDVFKVEDVANAGCGRPLYSDFQFEDWALLSARFEIHLLLHSFKKDLDDPDRPGFAEKDLAFYYSKYYKKAFTYKAFGVDTIEGFQELIQDTFSIGGERSFLEASMSDDTPLVNFVRLTEEHRRQRQRRLDAGDESADLKFPRAVAAQPPRQPVGPPPGGKGSGKGPAYPSYVQPRPSGIDRGIKRGYVAPASTYPAAKYQRPSTYGGHYGGGSYGGRR